jgi:hypothetical protein
VLPQLVVSLGLEVAAGGVDDVEIQVEQLRNGI